MHLLSVPLFLLLQRLPITFWSRGLETPPMTSLQQLEKTWNWSALQLVEILLPNWHGTPMDRKSQVVMFKRTRDRVRTRGLGHHSLD